MWGGYNTKNNFVTEERRMKKRLMSVLLCSAMVSAMLIGCGNKEETSTSEENVSEEISYEGETISILVDANTSTAGIEAVIAAAEAELGIKAEIEIQPGGSEGDNVIKTRLSSGTMNDICLYNSGSLLQALNPEEYFEDLSGQDFVKNFEDTYTQTVSSGDAIFGVPATSTQVVGWLYNKNIYEELNLEVPETWDELMANCQAIKDAGKTAVIASYKDTWTSQPIFLGDAYNILYGAPNFVEEYTAHEATFANTPSAMNAFQKLADTEPYINDDCMSTTYDMAIEMLATGEGAHYVMLTQALTNIYNQYPDAIDDIGIFAQPGATAEETGLTLYLPNSFYVNKNSEKKDAAIKWLEFYVSQAGADAYSSAVLPEGPSIVKGIELTDEAYPALSEAQGYLEDGKVAIGLEFLLPVKGANCPDICVNCALGKTSAEETAIEYDKDCEKQAKQMGLENW